jgi:hypothetical protein
MTILNLARQYNQFQQQVGNTLDSAYEDMIPNLFSSSFIKIANGIALVTNRSLLKDQLENVRKVAGSWVIVSKEEIPFQESNRCLIRYHLMSKDLGSYDVMAILTMDQEEKIQRIEENYYQIIK